MFSVNYLSRTPIYQQLYDQVIRFVSLGILSPGDKMPPIRSLAVELGVNPNTVQKAYSLLEDRGYIASAVGRGSFITNKLSADDAGRIQAEKEFREAVSKAVQAGLNEKRLTGIIREVTQPTGSNDGGEHTNRGGGEHTNSDGGEHTDNEGGDRQ